MSGGTGIHMALPTVKPGSPSGAPSTIRTGPGELARTVRPPGKIASHRVSACCVRPPHDVGFTPVRVCSYLVGEGGRQLDPAIWLILPAVDGVIGRHN